MNKSSILQILKKYKEENSDKFNIKQIGIFGSYARNQANESSDIDICIKTEVPDMFAIVHIKEDLEKLFSTNIDIIRIRDKMNPYLKKRIDQDAIYV